MAGKLWGWACAVNAVCGHGGQCMWEGGRRTGVTGLAVDEDTAVGGADHGDTFWSGGTGAQAARTGLPASVLALGVDDADLHGTVKPSRVHAW